MFQNLNENAYLLKRYQHSLDNKNITPTSSEALFEQLLTETHGMPSSIMNL